MGNFLIGRVTTGGKGPREKTSYRRRSTYWACREIFIGQNETTLPFPSLNHPNGPYYSYFEIYGSFRIANFYSSDLFRREGGISFLRIGQKVFYVMWDFWVRKIENI